MDIKDIQKLATLSRIQMTDEELVAMAKDFESILEYVAQIQEVTTDTGEKKPAVGMHHNIMREDEQPHEPGVYTDAIVRDMPETENGYLSVKKIL